MVPGLLHGFLQFLLLPLDGIAFGAALVGIAVAVKYSARALWLLRMRIVGR